MASVAQLVNDLQSLFFAHENRFCLTPTYHVFDLYSQHQAGRLLRTVISAPEIAYTWDGKAAGLRGLSSSASLKGSTVILTVTNPSLDTARATEIAIRGGHVKSVSAMVLAAKDAHAHNSFDDPRSVEPSTVALKTDGSVIAHQFPPASVTRFEVTIG